MRTLGVLLALAIAGCGMDSLPSCASVGCPVEPSGTPGVWSRCTTTTCWCWATGTEEQCSKEDSNE